MGSSASYKIMRLMCIFDKPVENVEERREYTKFRKFLIREGFMMLQYSIYVRYCKNAQACDGYIAKIREYGLQYGNVKLFCLTENQYEKMITICGTERTQEKLETEDPLIFIE